MSDVVTINPEKLGKTIRSYILVYEYEIPEAVDMAITLLVEAAQQSMADECQEPCELGGIHEFAKPVQICSKCGTRRLC